MPHTDEARDLLAVLAERREFVMFTARGLTDDQARSTPTASELCIGGLFKHLAATEASWIDFIVKGSEGQPDWNEVDWEKLDETPADELPEWVQARANEFKLLPDETLAGVIAEYERVAAATEATILGLESLDISHEVPPAPWVPEGETKSARKVLMHLIGETAQHAGHADIIRETIDGQKSMG